MFKSHKAFSAVKWKGQSNKVASQAKEAAKGPKVTEGHSNGNDSKELKQSQTEFYQQWSSSWVY